MTRQMRPILSRLRAQDIERFWLRVDRRAPTECWRYADCHSYGAFSVGRSSMVAHRVAWVISNQEELGGRLACHSCDNPWCVNPAHIWPGTHADNNRDTALKGRHYTVARRYDNATRRWVLVKRVSTPASVGNYAKRAKRRKR